MPSLHHNPRANFAILDTSPHIELNLNPDRRSLSAFKEKYKRQIFASTDEMLKESASTNEMLNESGPQFDRACIAMPYANTRKCCGKSWASWIILKNKADLNLFKF